MVSEAAIRKTGTCTGGLLTAQEHATWIGFLRAHAHVARSLDDRLSVAHGIGLTAYDVLVQVAGAPGERLRMSELADAVLLSRSGLTRLVGRLVDHGLLERAGCENDARGAYAVLTAAGRARLHEARATHVQDVRERFLSRLSAAEQQQLAGIWRRLLDA